MKHIALSFLILFFAITISACNPSNLTEKGVYTTTVISTKTSLPSPTITPTITQTQPSVPTATDIPTRTPYPTRTLTPIPSITLTPPPTLEPIHAEEALRNMMRDPATTQFWGIVPGRTTLGEAQNIFSRLGIPLGPTNEWSRYYSTRHEFDNELYFSVVLTIEDGIVTNIDINIDPEKKLAGISRQWLTYSPETLIDLYGMPSRVELALIWGPGTSSYFELDLYFDSVNLIVVYEAPDLIPWQANSMIVCPLEDDFDFIRMWLGDNPENPPYDAVPLEDATGLTIKEFTELIRENPEGACFELIGEAFP